jgi:hypothetical protein
VRQAARRTGPTAETCFGGPPACRRRLWASRLTQHWAREANPFKPAAETNCLSNDEPAWRDQRSTYTRAHTRGGCCGAGGVRAWRAPLPQGDWDALTNGELAAAISAEFDPPPVRSETVSSRAADSRRRRAEGAAIAEPVE